VLPRLFGLIAFVAACDHGRPVPLDASPDDDESVPLVEVAEATQHWIEHAQVFTKTAVTSFGTQLLFDALAEPLGPLLGDQRCAHFVSSATMCGCDPHPGHRRLVTKLPSLSRLGYQHASRSKPSSVRA